MIPLDDAAAFIDALPEEPDDWVHPLAKVEAKRYWAVYRGCVDERALACALSDFMDVVKLELKHRTKSKKSRSVRK